MRDLKLFIDGDFHAPSGGAWFDDFNPVNGEVCARVAEANADDVDRAVKAAKRALAGPWGSMSVAQRCALLDRVADGIDARREEFSQRTRDRLARALAPRGDSQRRWKLCLTKDPRPDPPARHVHDDT